MSGKAQEIEAARRRVRGLLAERGRADRPRSGVPDGLPHGSPGGKPIRRRGGPGRGARAGRRGPAAPQPAARHAGSKMRAGGVASGQAGAREAGPFREAAPRRRAARRPARNEVFALRKPRPALPTGRNFAAGGAVRAVVWPQGAEFLLHGGTVARPGDPSRCAAGGGMPWEAAPGNAAAALRGAARRSGEPAAMPAGGGPRFAGRGGRGRDAGRRRRDRGGRPRPGEICRSAALIRQAAAAAARRPAASRGGHSGPGRRRSRAARARRDSSRSATSGGPAARRTPATRRPRPGHPPPERTRGRSRKTARAGWRRT